MSSENQPTPEQRAAHVEKIRGWLADGACLFAREHVEPLLAEIDRLTDQLASEREVGPSWLGDATKALGQVRPDGQPLALNWTQVLDAIRKLRTELRAADRQVESLDWSDREMAQTIGRLASERDQARALLADRDEAARLNAEEHLETLRQLADEREDHNRATEGCGRAVMELREAAEAREKAEQLARAYQQTLEERTAERDQARAELAAARPKAGEAFLRVRAVDSAMTVGVNVGPLALVYVERTPGDWSAVGLVPRSAIVSPPPEAEGARVDAGGEAGGKDGDHG